MKRLFIGISYIVVVVMAFAYYLSPAVVTVDSNAHTTALMTAFAYTGVSVIGWLFLVPGFVFVILGLCINSPKVNFLRDVLCLFAALFTVATIILAFTLSLEIPNLWVVIILAVCAAIILTISTYGVVKALITEKNVNKEKENETIVQ